MDMPQKWSYKPPKTSTIPINQFPGDGHSYAIEVHGSFKQLRCRFEMAYAQMIQTGAGNVECGCRLALQSYSWYVHTMDLTLRSFAEDIAIV